MTAADKGAHVPRSRHARLRALQVLEQGAWPLSVDNASSMRPVLRGGESILWREAGKAQARPGDLLLYGFIAGGARGALEEGDAQGVLSEVPLVLAVHRVMRRVESSGRATFVTKGDSRPANDVERIPLEDVIGIVEAFEREGVRWSLEGRGARVYARLAWFTSLALGAAYRGAAYADAFLRRLLLGRVDVFFFRPLLAALQRAKHGFFHGVLFRACHRSEPSTELESREGKA